MADDQNSGTTPGQSDGNNTGSENGTERQSSQQQPARGDEQSQQSEATSEAPKQMKDALHKANEEAKNLRLKLREYEDRDKTEVQRLSDDRDGHKSRADKAELDLLRMNVGLDKGLSAAQSRRLVGATKADLEADADAMIEENSGTGQQQPATRKPREQLRGGGSSNEQEPQETDPAKLAAKIPR